MKKHRLLCRAKTIPSKFLLFCALCGFLCPLPVSFAWRHSSLDENFPPEAGALFNYWTIALGSSIVSGLLCRFVLTTRMSAMGIFLANSSGWYSMLYILRYVHMQSSVSIAPFLIICLSTSLVGLLIVWITCTVFRSRLSRFREKNSADQIGKKNEIP